MKTDFDESLWADLLKEPAASRALSARQPASRLEMIRRPLTIGGLAIAAGSAAVILSLTAASTPVTTAAYAVTRNADGSVTLTLKEVIGVSGANEQLARLGVRAQIAKIERGCTESGTEVQMSHSQQEAMIESEQSAPGLTGLGWVIHPSAIPAGDTVLISAQLENEGRPLGPPLGGKLIYAVGSGIGLYKGTPPSCQVPGESIRQHVTRGDPPPGP
jgi:hypothetical protein